MASSRLQRYTCLKAALCSCCWGVQEFDGCAAVGVRHAAHASAGKLWPLAYRTMLSGCRWSYWRSALQGFGWACSCSDVHVCCELAGLWYNVLHHKLMLESDCTAHPSAPVPSRSLLVTLKLQAQSNRCVWHPWPQPATRPCTGWNWHVQTAFLVKHTLNTQPLLHVHDQNFTHHSALQVSWPAAVLQWPECAEFKCPAARRVIWRGLRVCMGIAYGRPQYRKPLKTGEFLSTVSGLFVGAPPKM